MSKKWIFVIIAAVFLVLIAAAYLGYDYLSQKYFEQPEQQEIEEQEQSAENKAKDFTVYNAVGKEIILKERIGQPIVLNFWATWCGPCKTELPYFEIAYQKYGEQVDFIMINLDSSVNTVKQVRKFLSQNGYSFPVYYDTNGDASYTYGAYSIPMTVFIDENGVIQEKYIGVISEETLIAELETLIGG